MKENVAQGHEGNNKKYRRKNIERANCSKDEFCLDNSISNMTC